MNYSLLITSMPNRFERKILYTLLREFILCDRPLNMLLLLAVIVVLIHMLLKNFKDIVAFKRQLNFSKTVPGPAVFELLENVQRNRVLDWLAENVHKYGHVFRIWFGRDLQIFFSDPDDLQTILSSNALTHKARSHDLMVPWLGRGLLTNNGENWHQKRKLLTPAFHFKILSSFKGPMADCCDILVEQLNQVADGRTIDFYPYITLFALDVICETAMGVKQHVQLKQDSEYVKSTKLVCKILHEQGFSMWKRIPFLFNLSKAGRQRNAAIKILHAETRRVIKLRRSLIDAEFSSDPSNKQNSQDAFGSKRRLAFLDSLLLAQKESGHLTDANIQEEVDTFMFEGHDTTSSAIGFAIYLLSKHGEVQRRVFEETAEFVDREFESMPYLEAVIKETLRLYPSVPFFSRRVLEPVKIGDLTLPTGSFVSILAYMVHRNPSIYPDPEKFQPERFLNGRSYHPFAHVAFSAGPRNCIGQKFAMLELKCTLSKLLRAFEFLPEPGFVVNPLPELVIKSGNGIQVQLRKRT